MIRSSHLADSRKSHRGMIAVTSRQVQTILDKQAGGGVDISGGLSSASTFNFGQDSRNSESYGFFHDWPYVAANAIAKKVASQPICAGEIVGASANPERRTRPPGLKEFVPPFLKSAADIQDLNVIIDHPVLDAFSRPNHVQRKFEFVYLSVVSLLMTGQCYWIGGIVDDEENRDGKLEMWAIPSNWIRPDHSKGLFSQYILNLPGKPPGDPIPAENVARTYFPHPTDLKSSWSPMLAIASPARIDNNIIKSQLQMFERGIFPNVVVTVGRTRGPDGKLSDRRPVLKGHHRRQIVSSIRELWNAGVNTGDPAIIDGLIESIHKLHNNPQEMDWMNSGEQTKRRIMQAFGCNPIVVGEIVGSNRAQATEAQKQFAENAVNPICDALSETATDWVGPMYKTPKRLVIWIERYKPVDPEIELKRWETARKNDDVSRDEYRSHVLHLSPDDRAQRGILLSNPSGVSGAVQIMGAIKTGAITREIAARMFELFYELDAKQAEWLAGLDLKIDDEPAEVPALPGPGPANGGGNGGSNGESNQDGQTDDDSTDGEDIGDSMDEVRRIAASIERYHDMRQDELVRNANTIFRAMDASQREQNAKIDELIAAIRS